MFKINKYLSLLLIALTLLILIPSSFAYDNDTAIMVDEGDSAAIESIGDEAILRGSTDYYFDASLENDDGNGSIDNPYKYLTAARIKANANIHLANGEYNLDTAKSIEQVNIFGTDTNNTVIKYNGVAFNVWNSLTLTNLTISGATIINYVKLNATNTVFVNGYGRVEDSYGNLYGGAIYCPYYSEDYTPVVNINNCTFSDNYAEYGGAIYIDGGSLDIIDTMFINNFAYNFGGAIASEYGTKITISKSKFLNSYSMEDAGGAIYCKDSSLRITNVDIINSSATFGGAIATLATDTFLSYLNVYNSSAKWDGGAIYHLYGNFSSIYCIFNNNTANNGGALYIDNSTNLFIRGTSFLNNNAKSTAGAVYSICNTLKGMGSVRQMNTFRGNTAGFRNDEYEISSINLNIADGNYAMYKQNVSEITDIPSYYNSVDYNLLTIPKDQQASGNCWAFTALSVLESAILKASGEYLDLSEENMKNVIARFSDYGWTIDTNEGGYTNMPIGYLVSWLGPVNETDDVFDDHGTLSPIFNSVMHVQNVLFLKRDNFLDNDAIKKAVMQYGAVGTSMYYSNSYYRGNGYYCWYSPSINHAVTIVGWDDDYSRDNFYGLSQDNGNGAWIVRNSWGPDWDDDGYFYVSYYDVKFAQPGVDNIAYAIILNDTIRYDRNYQYDIAGSTDNYYTDEDTLWYKNVYTAEGDEFLAAVSTYFDKVTNWTASIYVNGEFKTLKEGVSNAGYYTFDLDEFIPLKLNDEFEVEFKVSSLDGISIPISEEVSLNKLIYKPGISFMSYDGINWEDLYYVNGTYGSHTYYSQVACIKAFTFLNEINTTTLMNVSFDGANSINVTARVIDQYGNLLNGIMTLNINGNEYDGQVINGIFTLNNILLYRAENTITAIFTKTGYKTSSDESVVHKSNVETSLSAENLTVNYNDGSEFIAQLFDSVGSPISGAIVKVINSFGVNEYITDDDGMIFASLDNLIPDEYLFTILFEGNEAYGASVLNASVVVNKVSVNIEASDISVSYKDGSNFTARLTDVYGKAVSGVGVKVISSFGIYNCTTDAGGMISVPLDNLKPGNHVFSVVFEGNNIYSASSLNRTVVVSKALVNMDASDVTVVYKEGGDFTVQLTDACGNPVSGVTVSVNNGVKTLRYRTDAEGVATVPISLKPGEYQFRVTFDGNSLYCASSANATVVVDRAMVNMEASDVTVVYKESGDFTVRLTDVAGNPVSGVTVSVNNGVKTLRYRTDAEGVATVPISLKPGEYQFRVTFDGNSLYAPSGVNSTVVVSKALVNMEASDVTVVYKEGGNFAVRLTDVDGNSVSGVTVKFDNAITAYRYRTDSNGVANAPINLKPGKYSYNISFAANSIYDSASIVRSLTVSKAKAILSAENFTMTYQDGSTFAVKLTDVEGKAISGATVKFQTGNTLYRYHTDANGVAKAPINVKPGEYNYTISFDGNSLYDATSITRSVVVDKLDAEIFAENVSMSFKDGSKYCVKLTDISGKAISGVIVKVNNTLGVYKYKTDSNGVINVPINLKPGEYEFLAFFEGNNIYNPINLTSTIIIRN